MKSLQNQYNLIKEGKSSKDVFLKSAKSLFPNYIPSHYGFNEAVNILKEKSIISESLGGVVTKGNQDPDWFKIFKENIVEAKAEEKKPTKEVVDTEIKAFDYKDPKNIDNIYGPSFLKGFYTEMCNPKNEGKTVDELKEIVAKNLNKNLTYYTENGQFGLDGVGYTTEHPGLGTSKEAKGKYKSSGYGDLKENMSPSNGFIIDKISKEPIFPEGKKLSVNDFLKGVENSPEAQKNIKSGVNFGKGIDAVKYLSENLPVELVVKVFRSPWNHGGNLGLRITVKDGTKYSLGSPFSYHSGYGSGSPTYFVGEYFKGMPHPDSGKPINPDNYYGSFKSISNHQGMLKDIVTIFKTYEKKHGVSFGSKESKGNNKSTEQEIIKMLKRGYAPEDIVDMLFDGDDSYLDKIFKIDAKLNESYDDYEYEVIWVDRDYNEFSKKFKNNPSGPPENARTKAEKFIKRLENKDKKSEYGLFRDIKLKSLVKESYDDYDDDGTGLSYNFEIGEDSDYGKVIDRKEVGDKLHVTFENGDTYEFEKDWDKWVELRKLNESHDDLSKPYVVVEKGGSIGQNQDNYIPQWDGRIIKSFDTAEEAKKYAKERRKRLTPGERSYYGISYVVKKNLKSQTNESYEDIYGVDGEAENEFLKNQKNYNQKIDWIKYEVDYVPEDIEVYNSWPEPYRSKALRALKYRKKNFKQMSDYKRDTFKESYDSSNDFEGTGLLVYGRTTEDNQLIDQAIEETGFHGIFNTHENYWFFPEDEETIDELENKLDTIFVKKGINARFEGQFNESLKEIGSSDFGFYAKSLRDVKKGDFVWRIMERFNPQLGTYYTANPYRVAKVTGRKVFISSYGDLESYDRETGIETKSKPAAYGSADYRIVSHQEMLNLAKENPEQFKRNYNTIINFKPEDASNITTESLKEGIHDRDILSAPHTNVGMRKDLSPQRKHITGTYYMHNIAPLLRKYNMSFEDLVKIAEIDELTSQELQDFDYVEDRIQAHLSQGYTPSNPYLQENSKEQNLRSVIQQIIKEELNEDEDPCWDGYEMIGMKDKDGKQVPNCVPKNENMIKLKDLLEAEYYETFKAKEKKEVKKPATKKAKTSDKIKAIETQGSIAALEAKIEALEEEITSRETKMKMATENEDFAEFVNEKKIKMMEKEVKQLQKAQEKYIKEYKKYTGEDYQAKKEIVDETEEIEY